MDTHIAVRVGDNLSSCDAYESRR